LKRHFLGPYGTYFCADAVMGHNRSADISSIHITAMANYMKVTPHRVAGAGKGCRFAVLKILHMPAKMLPLTSRLCCLCLWRLTIWQYCIRSLMPLLI